MLAGVVWYFIGLLCSSLQHMSNQFLFYHNNAALNSYKSIKDESLSRNILILRSVCWHAGMGHQLEVLQFKMNVINFSNLHPRLSLSLILSTTSIIVSVELVNSMTSMVIKIKTLHDSHVSSEHWQLFWYDIQHSDYKCTIKIWFWTDKTSGQWHCHAYRKPSPWIGFQ